MRNGSLHIGNLSIESLVAALPQLIEHLRHISFGSDGVALVDGAPLLGLMLLSGEHMETGATYSVVLKPATDEVHERVYLLGLEEVSTARLTALLSTTDPEDSAFRLDLHDPSNPQKLQLSHVQGSGTRKQLHDLAINVPTFRDPTSDHITITARSESHGAKALIRQEGPTSLNYRVDVLSDAGSPPESSLRHRMMYDIQRLLIVGWLRAAALVYRHVGKRCDHDPVAVLWEVSIGQVSEQPEMGSTKRLAAVARSAA